MKEGATRAILAAAVLLGALGGASGLAASVRLEATLILASSEEAPADPRLEKFESNLRRIFGFEHYRHYGEAASSTELPGELYLRLGHGYGLAVQVREGQRDKMVAHLRWLREKKQLLNTRVRLKKGVPAILGGPKHGEGTLIVVLIAR